MHSVSGRSSTEATLVLKDLVTLRALLLSGAVCSTGFSWWSCIAWFVSQNRHWWYGCCAFKVLHLTDTCTYIYIQSDLSYTTLAATIPIPCTSVSIRFHSWFSDMSLCLYATRTIPVNVAALAKWRDPGSDILCLCLYLKRQIHISEKAEDISPQNSVIWQLL